MIAKREQILVFPFLNKIVSYLVEAFLGVKFVLVALFIFQFQSIDIFFEEKRDEIKNKIEEKQVNSEQNTDYS